MVADIVVSVLFLPQGSGLENLPSVFAIDRIMLRRAWALPLHPTRD